MPRSPAERGPRAPEPEIRPETMRESDLDGVLAIERASFVTPWSRANFLHEMRDNPYAWNVVVREEGRVLAFACLWIVDEELHVNNIAVAPGARGAGLGTALFRFILREASARGCRRGTLEVRPSNLVARRLYERFGFRPVGVRKGYYADTREDALVLEGPIPPVAPA